MDFSTIIETVPAIKLINTTNVKAHQTAVQRYLTACQHRIQATARLVQAKAKQDHFVQLVFPPLQTRVSELNFELHRLNSLFQEEVNREEERDDQFDLEHVCGDEAVINGLLAKIKEVVAERGVIERQCFRAGCVLGEEVETAEMGLADAEGEVFEASREYAGVMKRGVSRDEVGLSLEMLRLEGWDVAALESHWQSGRV